MPFPDPLLPITVAVPIIALIASAFLHFCSRTMHDSTKILDTGAQTVANVPQEIDPFGSSPGAEGVPIRTAPVKIKAIFTECGSRTDEINLDWIAPLGSTKAEQGVDGKPPEAPQPPR